MTISYIHELRSHVILSSSFLTYFLLLLFHTSEGPFPSIWTALPWDMDPLKNSVVHRRNNDREKEGDFKIVVNMVFNFTGSLEVLSGWPESSLGYTGEQSPEVDTLCCYDWVLSCQLPLLPTPLAFYLSTIVLFRPCIYLIAHNCFQQLKHKCHGVNCQLQMCRQSGELWQKVCGFKGFPAVGCSRCEGVCTVGRWTVERVSMGVWVCVCVKLLC